MRTALIVYYSRTGTTKTLATALADKLNADLAEIRCRRYGRGIFRYLRAGYDSVRGNLPPIDMPQTATQTYDLVLLGAPIWTSHPALPLRAFLAGAPALPARVALFLTYGGHSSPDIAIRETEALLPGPLEACLSLRSPDVEGAGLSSAVDAFAEQLIRQDSS